jgi:hypothetical protein
LNLALKVVSVRLPRGGAKAALVAAIWLSVFIGRAGFWIPRSISLGEDLRGGLKRARHDTLLH